MEQKVRGPAAVLAAWLMIAPSMPSPAQGVDFTVAWTPVGEVISRAGSEAATVQQGARVSRVDVQPTIVEVAVGKQMCISTLQVQAFGPDGKPVAGAPLAIAVRQDHKQHLQLTHSKGICMRPARSGEYPIRFTSKVPAPDDTLRGAQIFLRVP